MIEIIGKYNNALVFTDNIENEAYNQIKDYLDKEHSKGLKIRVMPDVHQGYGVPIGFTVNIIDKIIPNFVGVDIGCGMLVTKISKSFFPINFKKLDDFIKNNIPHGFNINKERVQTNLKLENIKAPVNLDRAYKSLGTLGGGNHFIEINESENGMYLVIHSGSRHLGTEVAGFWTKVASATEYLSGDNFKHYLADMKITQEFASLNRKAMRGKIIDYMNFNVIEEFETIHNYIDLEEMILRKGAVSAKLDEKIIIPINMKDGSIIAKGLGNSNWNYSAPHGAGRVMGRNEAKKKLSLESFKSEMKDVWTTSVSLKTLDEAPSVYKSKNDILKHTKPTIVVLEHLKALYNFKA